MGAKSDINPKFLKKIGGDRKQALPSSSSSKLNLPSCNFFKGFNNVRATSGSSFESVRSRVIDYHRHGNCVLLTVFTIDNPGRRFYRCPRWQRADDCGHFEWSQDLPYTGRVREVLLEIITKKLFLEEKLNVAKQLKAATEEKLKMQEDKNQVLQTEVYELNESKTIIEIERKELQLENKKLKQEMEQTKLKFSVLMIMFLALLMFVISILVKKHEIEMLNGKFLPPPLIAELDFFI